MTLSEYLIQVLSKKAFSSNYEKVFSLIYLVSYSSIKRKVDK
jgi:hypothetical protein